MWCELSPLWCAIVKRTFAFQPIKSVDQRFTCGLGAYKRSITYKVICFQRLPRLHSSYTHLIRLMNTDFHKKTLKLSRSICFIVFGFGGCIFPSQLKSINYCVYERFFSDWLTIDEAWQWGFVSIEKTNNALAKSKCSSIKQRKQRGQLNFAMLQKNFNITPATFIS